MRFLLALLVASSLCCAHAKAEAPAELPADLRADVERASATGLELYALDQAAWHATDALAAKLGSLDGAGLGGYIVAPGDQGHRVIFVSRETPPAPLYVVEMPRSGEPRITAGGPPLSGMELAMLRARQLAAGAVRDSTQPMNAVVIPPAAPGSGIVVYLLATTMRPNVAVFGRHHRVEVAGDGSRVVSDTPLSKGPIELPTTHGPDKVVALTVTHFLTPAPTEAHVFGSLQSGMPVYVGTPRGVWLVDGAKISLVQQR